MILTSDVFPEYTCEVTANPQTGEHIGRLMYKGYDCGIFSGTDMAAVQAHFHTIADYAREGAMVRENIIITNYFLAPDVDTGEVMDMNGVILGSWKMDEQQTCSFTEDGATQSLFGAPSLWMVHDVIIDWHAARTETA